MLAKVQNKTTLIKDFNKTKSQSMEIAKGNVDDSFGTKRLFIWKSTVKIIPKHLLHGAGIDNFYFAFDGKELVYKNGIDSYDKAHNEYLQLIITEGLFALIVYLLLCVKTVYTKTKSLKKDKELYLILPVIGYLVQAFFNISVIEVAPIFYMFLGMCVTNNIIRNEK